MKIANLKFRWNSIFMVLNIFPKNEEMFQIYIPNSLKKDKEWLSSTEESKIN